MPHLQHEEHQAVLSCWKDIASYLGKGVRTVQRWEQDLGLPIRRPNGGGPKGPVTARKADLDNWLAVHWSAKSAIPAPATGGLSALAIIQEGNTLILASRQIHLQNKLLVNGLRKTVETLHLTCASLELTRAWGKEMNS
jgi:hypothetical protein